MERGQDVDDKLQVCWRCVGWYHGSDRWLWVLEWMVGYYTFFQALVLQSKYIVKLLLLPLLLLSSHVTSQCAGAHMPPVVPLHVTCHATVCYYLLCRPSHRHVLLPAVSPVTQPCATACCTVCRAAVCCCWKGCLTKDIVKQ